jgi:hypothetical protein
MKPEKSSDQLNQFTKTMKMTYIGIFIAWIVGALISVGGLVGIGYVALHFLQKYW